MTKQNTHATDRETIVSNVRAFFPHLAVTDTALSDIRGGRSAAEAALAAVKVSSYERTRNFLAGDVTRLSAYLRHGVLTLAEVRDDALRRVRDPRDASKLINEYAWRDYWQRIYELLGDGIWRDREAYKTGYSTATYTGELPTEIAAGQTTLRCIDSFAEELAANGYLHNHARMWMAAYVVHWRKTRWQAGARWFLEHLVDGDPASNNLSWQWIASTFSSKPYIFNRENLERYTAGIYCRKCPHAKARTCPFDQSYEALEQTLFPRLHSTMEGNTRPAPSALIAAADEKPSPRIAGKPLLWVHTDALNPVSPILLAHAGSPAIFVWDKQHIIESSMRLKRLVFISECLDEMPRPLEVRAGDVTEEVLRAAKTSNVDYILAQRTVDPRLKAAALAIERHLPLVWYDPPAFADAVRTTDLKRFSRYWSRAQASAMLPTRS